MGEGLSIKKLFKLRNPAFRSLSLALILLIFTTDLNAQNYSFIKYGLREGMPQSQVQEIIQDPGGLLWLATPGGGLAVFDGSQFYTYTSADGLPSNFVQCLASDQDGNIYAGTKRGIATLEGAKFINPIENYVDEILDMEFLNDSLIAFASMQGLLFFDIRNKKNIETNFPEVAINEIKKLNNGSLSVASDKGWWIVKSKAEYSTQKISVLQPTEKINSITQKRDESLLVISSDQKLNLYNSNLELLDQKTIPEAVKVNCSFVSDSDQLWLGTESHGILIKNEEGFTTISNELPSQSIQDIFQDNQGQIWLATSGGGLAKVLVQSFQHFNKSSGLSSNSSLSFAEDSLGRIWFGLESKGLAIFDNEQISSYQLDKDFLNVASNALSFDNENRLWVGTEGKGIGVFDSLGLFQILDHQRGLSSNFISSLASDQQGGIWVGTKDNGLLEIKSEWIDSLQRTAVTFIPQTERLNITKVAPGPDENIWFSTRQGKLGRIGPDKTPQFFDRRNGIPGSAIRTFKFDKNGGLWLGTAGEGLVYSKSISGNLNFFKHPVNPKLSSGNIYLIEIDRQGDLWIGNEKGLDRFSRDVAGNPSVSFYGYNQGFLAGETNPNASLLDKQGNLWFGAKEGIIRAKKGFRSKGIAAPVLTFAGIKIQNKPIAKSEFAAFDNHLKGLSNGLVLPWNVNQIEFELKAVHLIYPRSIKYRWRLEGLENEWSPPSTSGQVNYSNLSPGKYKFLAQASHNGVDFGNTISSEFSISSPLWKKPWFRWLLGLASAFFLLIFSMQRIKSVRKKESEKRRNLEMQNELLNLNQKALQLQMNPHFIFNTLNSINALVAKGENNAARKQINNFAKQLRSTLSNSRKDHISLQQEIEGLKEYLIMLQFCHSSPFEFHIDVEDRINREELELPPMIIQPFVENAVLHGFNQLERKGKLNISFALQGQLLVCDIVDNGVGRKVSAADNSKKHQSAGMEVTQARLDNLKGRLKYTSLEILDLEKNGLPCGTKVTVRIPIRVSY